MREAFKPDAEPGYFGALIIKPDGTVLRMDSAGRFSRMKADFYADGSGHAVARGAMAAGATAERAVQIAIDLDSACGGPIQKISLKAT